MHFPTFVHARISSKQGFCVHNGAGLLHCQATTDKKGLAVHRPASSPDISLLSPEMQEQWHVDKNLHLGAIQIKPHAIIEAVWQCNNCPAGQPHIWTARVSSRARGTHCPYCSNRKVCSHNCLATVAPDVAQFWNHSKNEKTPEQVVPGTSFRAEWKCPACNHEWQVRVSDRVRGNRGCPKCALSSRRKQSQPTFAEAQPAELAEWDHEWNEVFGFYPHKVTLGSGQLVHWICSRCPRGQPHRWTAAPLHRIGHGTGCAVCAGQQVCVCNSLESLFPSIAVELDIDANGFAPSEITAQSNKKVWWQSAKRGSWKQAVFVRTAHIGRKLRSNSQ
ncbi:hypothetical protein ABBQ38_001920 [Trebouxia sp. C0009 RCD-2024]